MILATYLPCKKGNIQTPIECFLANTPEELLVNSVLFKSDNLEEELLIFETNIYEEKDDLYYINTIPDKPITVPMGSVMEGDAFVTDNMGSEYMPELQKIRRKECELFMKKNVTDKYADFLKVQKQAFESYLLPLWAPILLSRLTGETYEIWPNAKLSPGDIYKINHKQSTLNSLKLDILNMYFAKNIKPNDLCWCHSGIKYKKCHGRVINE